MPELTLTSGRVLVDPMQQMLRFCQEWYAYYDALPSTNPHCIEPLDVLATFAMNSRINGAFAMREIHLAMARGCNPILHQIPQSADLLSANPPLGAIRQLFHTAVQSPGVLVAVATKVLHRKRPALIPMLDNVIMDHYFESPERSRFRSMAQYKTTAAEAGMVALEAFREDLRAAANDIDTIRQILRRDGYILTSVRILEALIWMDRVGYGKNP